MIYLQLIWVYLKIGLFGFGGGYAMLSLIQNEVVNKYNWLTAQEFTDIVAISQVTPGPIGINSATYIGYSVTGSVWGSIIATIAVSLPSFIMVLIISGILYKFKNNKWIDAAFYWIRPTSVGLILAAALMLTFHPLFLSAISASSEPLKDLYQKIVITDNFPNWKSILIFAITIVTLYKRWTHPIAMIGIAGILGLIFYFPISAI